jgi:hypothetical protein
MMILQTPLPCYVKVCKKKMKILQTTCHDKLGFVEGIINTFAMLD